jgi:hypothetical protein
MIDSVIKVGKRKEKTISWHASAEAFTEGVQFNESLQSLPSGGDTFIPKGVYFFKTHQEADKHRNECLIRGIAALATSRK